jgi:hypothetical protein
MFKYTNKHVEGYCFINFCLYITYKFFVYLNILQEMIGHDGNISEI